MNYQKDTSKNGINSYGHSSASPSESLVNKPIYEYVNKKTEKLVTALYMVTDCMDTEDALKTKIRNLGVELMSDMYRLPNMSPVDKKNHISITLSHASEIHSLIEISCTIGFISEMNTSILKRELSNLISELDIHRKEDKHFTYKIDEEMFEIPRPSADKVFPTNNVLKDKRTSFGMSFRTNNTNPSLSLTKGLVLNRESVTSKEDRTEKILKLIKDKKEVSIKDISIAFTDCSEKTIQRELNSLVSKNQIKKIGEKRWSRYQAI